MSDVRPIFLVGCARSGTTLLSVMMHAHPRIAMPPETRFLLPVYRNRAKYGDLREAHNRRRLARRLTRPSPRFLDLGLNRGQVIRTIMASPPTLGTAMGTVWRQFAHDRGKARWGEKRPAYWEDLDVILRLFPTAQIIHLVRDGRAAVASLQNVRWYDGDVVTAAVSWWLAEHELTRWGRALPPDSYHRLRYEDLLATPRSELTRLCYFLGEPFDERMLDFAGAADDIVPGRKIWHDRTRGELDTARVQAWRSTLSGSDIGLLESVLGRSLQARGYELSGVGRPARADVARFHVRRAGRLATMRRRQFEDARRVRRDAVPLADAG